MSFEFFLTEGGNCPVQEFLEGTPEVAREMGEQLLDELCEGTIRPKRRSNLSGSIWELRWSHRGVQYRITYCNHGGRFVLLSGFVKKTQVTPRRQIDLAKRRYREWRETNE